MPFEISDFKLDPEPVEVPIPAPVPTPAAQPMMASAAPARSMQDGPASMLPPSVDFDFGDLSLDVEPHAGKGEELLPVATAVEADLPDLDLGGADDNEPMARKIELADEFRRIGDHEGARELLEEVVSKADGPLRTRAQSLLEALG
jgi:pilus assembly protein FimV